MRSPFQAGQDPGGKTAKGRLYAPGDAAQVQGGLMAGGGLRDH